MNARSLEEQGIEGPQSDHNEEKDSKLEKLLLLFYTWGWEPN